MNNQEKEKRVTEKVQSLSLNDNKKKLFSAHWKRYGFINQNSEIYQGFAKTWDLGPNGAELKRKIKELWQKFFITSNSHNMLCETTILTTENVLEASGHKKNFNDWTIFCEKCKKRVRLDKIISGENFKNFLTLSEEKKENYKLIENCKCKGNFSYPQKFNLMIKADIQTSKLENEKVYLRPETCQGIFVNFLLIKNSTTKKLPFGIGQIGKSFRNEVTLNHGIFRTREFEQAELEFFIIEENEKEKWWNFWNNQSWNFFQRIINEEASLIKKINIQKEELPHYSQRTIDFHFLYNFGWGEVCSLSDRGDYDLKNHSQKSGFFLGIKNSNNEFKYPHVIEISFGIERLLLAILESSYQEEKIKLSNNSRTFLKINPLLSPFFASVIPLSKQLTKKAKELYLKLIKTGDFSISYEETGNIGNRYRRQDAIGTFFCITVDFETENDNCVTIRERDNMQQKRVNIDKLNEYLTERLKGFWNNFLS